VQQRRPISDNNSLEYSDSNPSTKSKKFVPIPLSRAASTQQQAPSVNGSTGTGTPQRRKLVHSASVDISESANTRVMPSPLPATPLQKQTSRNSPANSQQSSRQVSPAAAGELAAKLAAAIRSGDARTAHKVLNTSEKHRVGVTVTPAEASQHLLTCYSPQYIGQLAQPKELMVLLLERLQADPNTKDPVSGRTALHYILANYNGEHRAEGSTLHRELAGLLLMRGADVMLEDEQEVSALSLSLSKDIDWLLVEFEASGREVDLLENGSQIALFKYTTSLILSGYSARAAKVLEGGRVVLTAEDATELLSNCSGNFDAMKEPVETFELLESLGAKLA